MATTTAQQARTPPHAHMYHHHDPHPGQRLQPHSTSSQTPQANYPQQPLHPPQAPRQQPTTLPTPASSTSNTPSTSSPLSPPYLFPNSSNKNNNNTTSATTPVTTTTSILSPNFGFQAKQLRPARTPLYVPAVLRPTEHYGATSPKRKRAQHRHGHAHSTTTAAVTSPLTPPTSAGGSLDGHESEEQRHQHQQNSSLSSSAAKPIGLLGRRASWLSDLLPGKLARIVTDEWTLDESRFEDVTGLPTRDHWKPDTSTSNCETPACPTQFSLLTRRHHCRRCGRIFCASCSSKAVPLDEHARFHPQGRTARACNSCWVDYGTWARAREERRSRSQEGSAVVEDDEDDDEDEERDGDSASDGSDAGSGSTTPVPRKEGAGDADAKAGKKEANNRKAGAKAKKKADALVGSVPRDWNWSTF